MVRRCASKSFTIYDLRFTRVPILRKTIAGPIIAGVLALGFAALPARAQWYNLTTLAGSAGIGSANGATNLAQFNHPGGAAMDTAGNVYVADTGNHVIRLINPAGVVSTLAGSVGICGSTNGTGTNALFNSPQAVAVDGAGNVYVSDTGNNTIRKITPAGVVTTLAGSAGMAGSANGTGTNALFDEPEGIAVDVFTNVFVADTWNHDIREISPAGVVTTLAGSAGVSGSTNATGTNALFYEPAGVAVDAADNVYVADTGNNVIRLINSAGAVSTLAGSAGTYGTNDGVGPAALFNSPQGIATDGAGNIYVADYLNNSIRQVTLAGEVTTIAGSAGNFGTADGTNGTALFWGPQGLAVNPANSGDIRIADTGNSTLRQLTRSGLNWVSGTLAGVASVGSRNQTGANARFFWPMNAARDTAGNLYVADAGNDIIRKVTPAGTVSTFAGSAGISGSADGANALFNAPQAVAVDSAGNVFVSDTGNHAIRKITPAGSVSTLAGQAGNSGSSDGDGTNAQFFAPQGIVVNGSDTVFVADTWNHTIREITSAGTVTTIAGVAGEPGSADAAYATDGTNASALFNRPMGLALDGAGDLFVADTFNQTIREISAGGVVSTLAGVPGVIGATDGTNCGALFFDPESIAVDNSGNLYVADAGNQTLREISPSGTNWIVSTVAGWPGNAGSVDGSGIAARFDYPGGLVLGTNGTLLVIDSGNNTVRFGTVITNNPPTLLTQPQSQTVNQDATVTFTASAGGAGPFYFQWNFDGSAIPGATATSLTLTNVQTVDAGDYSVTVSSPTGTVTSSNAVLTIYAPPVITSQPASLGCLQGSNAVFNVTASPASLTYQWLLNGVPLNDGGNLNGSATATLTITNTTAANDANYSVIVNDGYGSVTSSVATLTVFPVPPADSIQPYAWWQLNEGAGTEAFDYSGNGHYGNLGSGVIWTNAGHGGVGAYFNGTNGGAITLGASFTLSSSWTAVMWVNRWGAKDSSVIIGGSSDALKLEQHSNTNHVGFTVYSVADYPLAYTTPMNAWVHLAFVKTSSGISLYTNGVFCTSSTHTASLNAVTIGLGYPTATTDYLDATLNDLRLYNQALTAAQITNLYVYDRITPIPSVTLTAPTNNAVYTVPAAILLAANVVSNGLNPSGVAFYSGTNLIGLDATPPYTRTWTNVFMGSYSLTAQVTYNSTNSVTSAPVTVSVAPATGATNLVFTVTNNILQLAWPLDHTGWLLQVQTNTPGAGLGPNWFTLANSSATNQFIAPVSPTNGSVFYRLMYP